MSLSDLASLGSFVSGIGVLVSLIYLAIQTRQNANQLLRTEAAVGPQQFSAVRAYVINSYETADVLRRGWWEPQSLDATNQLRFDLTMEEWAWATYGQWERSAHVFANEASYEQTNLPMLKSILSSPGGSAWWARRGTEFPSGFQNVVRHALATNDPPGRS
jgi:hypothetical protein